MSDPTQYFQQAASPSPSSHPTDGDPSEPTRPESHQPKPLLRLEAWDLSHPGSRAFLSNLDASTALAAAAQAVTRLLYPPNAHKPPTRSVTLILRAMPGVAYTKGKEIDDDHKEIHFSTEYINRINPSRVKEEMLGVLTHEMVHCWQWNGRGSAPGGLIEGIADWIRLRSGLAPPHWRKDADCDWDVGYNRTAYFLDYLEHRFGPGTVVAINEELRDKEYVEEKFWKRVTGENVTTLWAAYKRSLEEDHAKNDSIDARVGEEAA